MTDPIIRLDNFHTQAMGYPLSQAEPGEIHVVTSERRLQREEGYGLVFAFWMLFSYDRCVISVRPDLKESIEKIVRDASDAKKLFTAEYKTRIDETCRSILPGNIAGRLRQSQSYGFYVNKEHFRPFAVPGCRRLTEDDRELIQVMAGSNIYFCPEESLQDGTAFGVIKDGKLVSFASVVPTPEATSRYGLSWPGVETLPEYRRRGYAKAVVSGVTETLLARGIIPAYSCSVTNIASANTAQSVGYQLYGERLQWRYQSE